MKRFRFIVRYRSNDFESAWQRDFVNMREAMSYFYSCLNVLAPSSTEDIYEVACYEMAES